jgi:ATP synthase protein I
MDEAQVSKSAGDETAFIRQVGAQASRKLKARRPGAKSPWFGLGMSGLVGWSVSIPALLGAMLGVRVDRRYPSAYSWTLMLLLLGLIIGCFNAWHWLASERRQMRGDHDE